MCSIATCSAIIMDEPSVQQAPNMPAQPACTATSPVCSLQPTPPIATHHAVIMDNSWLDWRSYQCPPDSCRNPPESGHSGGFRWNKIWQEGLLKFSFQLLFILAESGHSRIETRMVRRMAGMECNQNPVVWLYHLPNKQLFGIGLHTQCQT